MITGSLFSPVWPWALTRKQGGKSSRKRRADVYKRQAFFREEFLHQHAAHFPIQQVYAGDSRPAGFRRLVKQFAVGYVCLLYTSCSRRKR